MLHIVKLIKRQTTEQGPMRSPTQSPSALAPCHTRGKIAVSTDPSSGSRRRRKRTKGKKTRAAAAKKTAWRLDAAKLLEEERQKVMLKQVGSNTEGVHFTNHVESEAKEENTTQKEEGKLGMSRAGCQERTDTKLRHTMHLGEEPAEEQPEVGHCFVSVLQQVVFGYVAVG